MDPITHALLGAAIGYAGFGRKLGRTAASAGALAAFAPDADIFIRSAADPLLAIEYHRHFTHALPFAPIGAAIAMLPWLFSPPARKNWILLWLCCVVGYISHSLLDAATSYGTVLLWPFSQQRFGWDLISIIDPVFTIPLAVGLIWALKIRRVRPAVIVLGFAVFYITLGEVQGARAAAAQNRLAATRGHTIERREIMPTLANNVVWRTIYLHHGKIFADRIRVGWFSGATVIEGWSLPQETVATLTTNEQAWNQRRSFERFNWFSEGWVARSPGDAAVLGDMRYSLSTEAFDPIWGIRFTPVKAAQVEWVSRSRDRRIDVKQMWNEIIGQDARYRALPDP